LKGDVRHFRVYTYRRLLLFTILTDRLSKTGLFASHYNYIWNMKRQKQNFHHRSTGNENFAFVSSIWQKKQL
jgi:hypothetical protein